MPSTKVLIISAVLILILIVIIGVVLYSYSGSTPVLTPTPTSTTLPSTNATPPPTNDTPPTSTTIPTSTTLTSTTTPPTSTTPSPPVVEPIKNNVKFCEDEAAWIVCPSDKKLIIDKWQYWRPITSTCGGSGWPSCPGADYAGAANELVYNNRIYQTGRASNYLGFSDPCPGILKQSDVTYTCK